MLPEPRRRPALRSAAITTARVGALVAVGLSCASNQAVLERLVDKIAEKCYQADEILITESGSLKVGLDSSFTVIQLEGGHVAYVKNLRPVPKDKEEEEPQQPDTGGNLLAGHDGPRPRDLAPLGPAPFGRPPLDRGSGQATSTTVNRFPAPVPAAPPLRPAVAVAVDPAYGGANGIDLGRVEIRLDGQPVALGPDATALAQLNQQQPANWTLVAAPSDLPVGNGAEVRFDVNLAMTAPVVPGQPLDDQVPFLVATRLTGSGPFDIDSGSDLEVTAGPLVVAIDPDDATLDAGGAIAVPAGTDLTLESVAVWNDTAAAVSGTLRLEACQGVSCLPLHSAPLTVAGLDKTVVLPPSLGTSALAQGDYEIEARVEDAGGAVIDATRHPLRLTGPDPTIALTGMQTEISLSAGGRVDLWVGADAAAAGVTYTIYMSGTGGIPGIDLGDVFVPLVNDAWTSLGISLLGTPNFPGGTGTLDATGFATAAFVVDPGTDPGLAGTRLYFAPLVDTAPRRSSAAPHVVELVP